MNVGADCVGGAGSTTAKAEARAARGYGNGSGNAEHLDHRGVRREEIEAGENATEVDAVTGGFQLDVAEIDTGVDIAADGVAAVDRSNGEGDAGAGTLANGEGTSGGFRVDRPVVIGVDREGADRDFAIGPAPDILDSGREWIIDRVAGHHQSQAGSASTGS